MRHGPPRQVLAIAALAAAVGSGAAEARPDDRAAPGRARLPPVHALALPARRGHEQLADAARRTARALAARLDADASDPRAGSSADPGEPGGAGLDDLARGIQLSRAGALDAAAAALDPALDGAARSPQRIADPAGFLAALVTRVSIALARGETARADALLARLLQYDPAFALTAGEDSPRMRDALERSRSRAAPALAVASLGDACGGRVLVVARGLATGSTELLRFDDCRLLARTEVPARFDADGAAALLDPTPRLLARPRRASSPAAASPPFYRRAWFWTAVGAIVIGGTAGAIYAGARDSDAVTVVPHL